MTMKPWLIAEIVVALTLGFGLPMPARASDINVAALEQNSRDACPEFWEDVRSEIDPGALAGPVWNGNTVDKEAFKSFIAATMAGSAPAAEELETLAADPSTVASECAAQRIALLDGLLAQVPSDALAAMDAVVDQLEVAAEAVERGGWLIGDLRITGLAEPSPGWLFLAGQTIGKPGSGAGLTGDILEELYALARHWPPNTGDEVWSDGDVVTLPDMRGRLLVGANTMGGGSSTILSNAAADRVGGEFGEERHALTIAELPSHSHGMGSAGKHSHAYTYRGHESGVASGSGATAWKSNQSRSTNSRGAHSHSVHSIGGGQAHSVVQPGMAFHIEIKFARGTDGDLATN